MTLPSQLPSAESTATPSDPFVCLGATPAQNTAGTPSGASFDSVFSQTGDAVSTVTADASVPTVPAIPVDASLTAMYPVMTYMGPSLQPVNVLPAVNAKSTPGKTEAPCNRTPAKTTTDQVSVDTGKQQTAESPVLPLPSVTNFPAMYPSIAYMVPSLQAVNTVPAASPEVTPVKAGVPCRPTSTEVSDGGAQVAPTEQPEPAKNADQPTGDVVLAYQLIAGQWVPQSVTQALPQPVSQPSSHQSTPTQSATAERLIPGNEQQNAWMAKTEPSNILQKQQAAASTPESKGFCQARNTVEMPGQSAPETSAPVVPALVVSQPRAAEPTTVSSATPVALEPTKADGKNLPLSDLTSTTNRTAEAASVVAKNPPIASATVSDAVSGPLAQNVAQAADIRTTSGGPVKIADPRSAVRAETESGVNPSTDEEEKKTVTVDRKKVNTMTNNVGTRGANREISMSYSVSNKPASAEFTTAPTVSISGGIQPGSTAPVVATTASSVVQAPRLVEEIRAIADRISVIDRNSVEVRFDFNDSERLSVRVEYRDGTVHTTFRTDSSQLRDVISTEWQAQAATAEQHSYRVADPVFNSPNTKQQEFSSLGDGSGRQRTYDQSAQSGGTPSFSSPGRNASSNTTVTAALPAARSETSRHLHTFA